MLQSHFFCRSLIFPNIIREDVIIDYALPAYQGNAQQSFAIDNTFMINAAAVLDNARNINDYLYKDGEHISDRSTYNNTASYDNTTTQSLRITYNNTDDIAGHYVHIAAAAYFYYFSTPTCPDHDFIRSHYFLEIPVFTLYWNIRSHGKFINQRSHPFIFHLVCVFKNTITITGTPSPSYP